MAAPAEAAILKKFKNRITLYKKPTTDLNSMFGENEMEAINRLKGIYLGTVRVDVELQQALYNLEMKLQAKHHEIFDKRRDELAELRKNKDGKGPLLKDFWLRVFKNSYTEFISKKDESILMHLIDVRSTLFIEPDMHFVLEFFFEPNEYFTDRVLRKTYFMNCLADAENPLSYDGAEIYRSAGSKINWTEKGKKMEDEREDFGFSSFFDFFSPPELPKSDDDPNFVEINAILQNDFELGFYLKERVIPKAILFYTGEANDCQSESDQDSCSEEDSDADDDDDEDEEASEIAKTVVSKTKES